MSRDKLDLLLNDLEEKRKELKESLKGYFKDFLLDNPDVKMIAFRGGTPSFNDGDPCEFWFDEDCDIADEFDTEDLNYYIDKDLGLQGSEAIDMFKFLNLEYSERSTKLDTLYSKICSSDDIELLFRSMFDEYGFKVKYYMKRGSFITLEEDYEMDY